MQPCDVALYTEVMRDFAVPIAHRRDHQIREVLAAILAPIDEPPAPRQPTRDHGPHLLVNRDGRRLVGKQRLVGADQFFLRIPGHPRKCRIDVENPCIDIADRNGEIRLLDRLLEHLRHDGARWFRHFRDCCRLAGKRLGFVVAHDRFRLPLTEPDAGSMPLATAANRRRAAAVVFPAKCRTCDIRLAPRQGRRQR